MPLAACFGRLTGWVKPRSGFSTIVRGEALRTLEAKEALLLRAYLRTTKVQEKIRMDAQVSELALEERIRRNRVNFQKIPVPRLKSVTFPPLAVWTSELLSLKFIIKISKSTSITQTCG